MLLLMILLLLGISFCNLTFNILHIHHFPRHTFLKCNVTSSISDGIVVPLMIFHVVVFFNLDYLYVVPHISSPVYKFIIS